MYKFSTTKTPFKGEFFKAGVGGGVNPSPREEGKGEVGSYQYSTLNHLSPEGWWD